MHNPSLTSLQAAKTLVSKFSVEDKVFPKPDSNTLRSKVFASLKKKKRLSSKSSVQSVSVISDIEQLEKLI